jgi:DNA-binding NtrC family response regulator
MAFSAGRALRDRGESEGHMSPLKRKKILVLDTDADRLVVVEQMLEDAGYDTTITWDVRSAKELLAGDGFSLVLIGEHPPEIDRSEIVEAVWSKSPAIPCVIMRSARSWFAFEDRTPGAYSAVSRCTLSDVVDHVKHCLQPSAEEDCATAKCVSAA